MALKGIKTKFGQCITDDGLADIISRHSDLTTLHHTLGSETFIDVLVEMYHDDLPHCEPCELIVVFTLAPSLGDVIFSSMKCQDKLKLYGQKQHGVNLSVCTDEFKTFSVALDETFAALEQTFRESIRAQLAQIKAADLDKAQIQPCDAKQSEGSPSDAKRSETPPSIENAGDGAEQAPSCKKMKVEDAGLESSEKDAPQAAGGGEADAADADQQMPPSKKARKQELRIQPRFSLDPTALTSLLNLVKFESPKPLMEKFFASKIIDALAELRTALRELKISVEGDVPDAKLFKPSVLLALEEGKVKSDDWKKLRACGPGMKNLFGIFVRINKTIIAVLEKKDIFKPFCMNYKRDFLPAADTDLVWEAF